MRRKKKVERAIRVTLERFENGQFCQEQMRKPGISSGDPDRFCLVGSLKEQLVSTDNTLDYVMTRPAYDAAIRQLGFPNEAAAMKFNDRGGQKEVIEHLHRTLEGGSEYATLHRALNESRVAHAKRDLGKGVPSVVPLAWIEQQVSETFVEVTA